LWKQKETIKANKTRLSTTPSTVIHGHWSVVLGSWGVGANYSFVSVGSYFWVFKPWSI